MLERDARWWAIYTALLAENHRALCTASQTQEEFVERSQSHMESAAVLADLAFVTGLLQAQVEP
jgi:hypothetical protein